MSDDDVFLIGPGTDDYGDAREEGEGAMSIDYALSRLTDMTRALDAASDTLDSKITSITTRIRATGVGLSVWLVDVRLAVEWQLGYTKIGNVWTLAVRHVTAPGEFDSPIDLLNAPRHVRVEAPWFFENLVEALITRTQALIQSTRDTL